jgi:hypothetical protein
MCTMKFIPCELVGMKYGVLYIHTCGLFSMKYCSSDIHTCQLFGMKRSLSDIHTCRELFRKVHGISVYCLV